MQSEHHVLRADDRNGAELSEDREYRYRLWRQWDAQKPTLAFIMLNPSTADESEDDPTIRRCLGYAEDFEFDKLSVHRGMGGDYWRVTSRLYNFDAKEIEYYDRHEPTDVTREWDRREYELMRLDPSSLGTETMRLSEHDLVSHFNNEATEEQAREHYKEAEA